MAFVERVRVFLLEVYDTLTWNPRILPACILVAVVLTLLSFPFPGLRIPLLFIVGSLWFFLVIVYLNFRYRPRIPKLGHTPPQESARPPGGEHGGVSLGGSPKPRAVVSTGFSLPATPDSPIGKRMTLACGTEHLFWIRIGEPVKGSIELRRTSLPRLPGKALITVTLVGFSDGLITVPGADIGRMEVQPDGSALVLEQPLAATGHIPPSSRLDCCLFFPVRTPPDPTPEHGPYRMRCNIYHKQVLIQSREIQAMVTAAPVEVPPDVQALVSITDYNLSRNLKTEQLSRLGEHRLSILLNESGGGTHSLHMFGTDGKERWKNDDIRFKDGELQALVDMARMQLRMVSWGDKGEWRTGMRYRYEDNPKDTTRLKEDLHRMAYWGAEFYQKFFPRLAGHVEKRKAFEAAMAEPGLIQLAMKESARSILPLALVYDYPFDKAAGNYSLCPTFTDALDKGIPLQETACFQGACPSRGTESILCPSGFWGFRHAIGMPISVREASDAPATIEVKGKLRIAVAVSTALQRWDTHAKTLQAIRGDAKWSCAATRDKVLAELSDDPHLVYFYCHGVVQDGYPWLQIGTTEKPETIHGSDFKWWAGPRPLVFINGCHTTAADPLWAFSLSEQVVVNARGAGAIGTEISVFEPLATAFAEECLRLFLEGTSIGWAIRNARLKLLADRNPLGLVYIPYAMAGLQLEPVANPFEGGLNQ